eukprot:gene37390-45403_t
MERHIIAIAPSSISGPDKVGVWRGQELKFLTLPHPSNQSVICTVLNNELFELNQANLYRNSCLMIDQRLSSSKSLYFLSKLDVRFLVVPFLEKAAGKFSPLDQIIFPIKDYSAFPMELFSKEHMSAMCDINDKYDEVYYRYNEEKLLAWLKDKVTRATAAICAQRRKVFERGQLTYSSSFNVVSKSSENTDNPADGTSTVEDERAALELVSDYLSTSLSEKLFALFNAQTTDVWKKPASSNKRKADWELSLEQEQMVGAPVQPLPKAPIVAPVVAPAAPKQDAKSKALAVAAKGTKSIQNFFGGKK